MLRKIVIKDLSLYGSQDGTAHKDFRQQIADDMSHVAESLINKGQALCSCRGRAHLDENEAKFVQMVVEALQKQNCNVYGAVIFRRSTCTLEMMVIIANFLDNRHT
ncbi:hypothetical protein MTO96_024146 [Rhipicephalus appendiculatus]